MLILVEFVFVFVKLVEDDVDFWNMFDDDEDFGGSDSEVDDFDDEDDQDEDDVDDMKRKILQVLIFYGQEGWVGGYE